MFCVFPKASSAKARVTISSWFAGPDPLWSKFQPPALMNQLLTSPPEPSIINAFAFFGVCKFLYSPLIWVFFHFTSLEVDLFLLLLFEDPVAIHRASDWKSQNTAFIFFTVLWMIPSICEHFFLQGGAQIQKS